MGVAADAWALQTGGHEHGAGGLAQYTAADFGQGEGPHAQGGGPLGGWPEPVAAPHSNGLAGGGTTPVDIQFGSFTLSDESPANPAGQVSPAAGPPASSGWAPGPGELGGFPGGSPGSWGVPGGAHGAAQVPNGIAQHWQDAHGAGGAANGGTQGGLWAPQGGMHEPAQGGGPAVAADPDADEYEDLLAMLMK